MANIKFISYDGRYPNLCSGTLVLNIDGEDVKFPRYCLSSGGYVCFDGDWNADVGYGPWSIDEWAIPEKYKHLQLEILEVINENIPWGCCGGCV